jgi:PAS domain S-box-containing protein
MAALYAVIGGAAIVLAEHLLKLQPGEASVLSQWTDYRRWGVVALTGLVLYFLLRHELRKRERREAAWREAEAALRASQAQLARTEAIARVMVAHVGLDGRWLKAPPALCRLLGYTEAELLALSTREVTHPDDRAADWTQHERLFAGEIQSFELEKRLQRKDGRPIWVYVNGSLHTDGAGKPLHCLNYLLDITPRKAAEAFLNAQRRVLEKIALGSPLSEVLRELVRAVEEQSAGLLCSVLVLDKDGCTLRTGAAPSLPESYNRAVDGLVIGPDVGSCGTAAFLGKPVIVADIATDPKWAAGRELALKHGLRACWSTPILSKPGKVIGTFAVYYREPRVPTPAELGLIERVTYLAGIALEHALAEEALRRGEARQALILDSAPLNLYTAALPPQFGTTWVSANFERLTGYSARQMLEDPTFWRSRLHPEDRERVLADFDRLLNQGAIRTEYRWRFADGSYHWLLDDAVVRRDERGAPAEMFGSCLDITERKRLELFNTALTELGRRINTATTAAQAARVMADVADQLFGWDACSLDFFFPEQNTFRPVLMMDVVEGRRVDVTPPDERSQPTAMFRKVVAEGAQLALRDAGAEGPDDLLPFGDKVRRSLSLMFVPIRHVAHVSGVLSLQSYRPRAYTAEDLARLQALADYCATALERIHAQEALRQSEERFNLAAQATTDAVWDRNMNTGETWWSQRAYELLGYRPGEVTPNLEAWAARVHPDDLPRIMQDIGASVEAGRNYWLCEYRLCLPDGAVVHVVDRAFIVRDAAGRPVRMIGGATDVTERKRAEQALRDSEAKARAILENAADGIITADDRGVIESVNPAAAHIFGYAPQELIGLNIKQLIPRPYLIEHESYRSLTPPASPPRLINPVREVVGRRRDGEPFPLDLAVTEMHLGGRRMHTAIVRDNTERKRAQDEVASSHSMLRALAAHLQSIREDERARIAREVHDELGQALTGIKMDIAWITARLPDGEKPVRERVKSMSALVDGTIQTVRKIATELRPGVLDNLGLVAALEWQAGEFQARTGIACSLDAQFDDRGLGQERRTAVFRILQETLTNVARHSKASAVTVTLKESAGQLVMEIKDNGQGMTAERISNSKSLGLLGMKERALILGGELQIASAPGQGTAVTVRVPLTEAAKDQQAA